MRSVFKGLIAAAVIAGGTVAATAPAEARYHGYHRGGDRTGTALLAGAIGLGVGAAIASNHYDRGYDNYDRGYAPAYYGGYSGYSGYAPVYYSAPPVVYYGGGYGYYGDYGRGYRGHYDRGYRGGYGRGYDRGGYGRGYGHGYRR